MAPQLTINSKPIFPICYGLMGLGLPAHLLRPGQEPLTDDKIFSCLRTALEHGANFWNGGEFYGTPDHNSLTILRRYFDKYPGDAEKVVLSIKGCMSPERKPVSSTAEIRASIENCVRMLGPGKKIDVFEPARVPRGISIEETMAELVRCRDEGLIGAISLSEASADTLRRAAAVCKLEFLEIEVSMFEDNVWTGGVAAAAAELGIPILGYSPLGRGFMSGQVKSQDDLNGIQKNSPRYQGENFKKNLELVEKVKQAAEKEGVTPAQYAIAWVRSRSELSGQPVFIPLPGASSPERVAENLTEKNIPLERFTEIDEFLKTFSAAGERYDAQQMKNLNG